MDISRFDRTYINIKLQRIISLVYVYEVQKIYLNLSLFFYLTKTATTILKYYKRLFKRKKQIKEYE
jgi:hypothetical protein